jgi:hypothetical protein
MPLEDTTAVRYDGLFAGALGAVIELFRPRLIVESGTYRGLGTTRIVAERLRNLSLRKTRFFSIECNPQYHTEAVNNLKRLGLFLPSHQWVQPVLGLSIPREQLPTLQEIERNIRDPFWKEVDAFVDYDNPKTCYDETNFHNIPDDMIRMTYKFGDPDFFILDSAGHVGGVEFQYILGLQQEPCIFALDDTHTHYKHYRDYRQMVGDHRFCVLSEDRKERYGWAIAKYQPKAVNVDA